MTLPELEVNLRESFQTYRRRLDMLSKFKAQRPDAKSIKLFVKAMAEDNESECRRVMKVLEVTRERN